jgi:hypothetical protein
MHWKRFQKEVAELFRSVGCFAGEDHKVTGARGEHKVDVYVNFKALSVECSWIVECKYWDSNITKEKVLTLQSIVQDVGADKGVLVSKKEFQSGAIRCAQKSNIILTNLEDLRRYIDDEIRTRGWKDLTTRTQYLSWKLLHAHRDTPNYSDIGFVSAIEMEVKDAQFGAGRMVLIRSLDEKPGEEVFVRHRSPERFIAHANRLLDQIQERNKIPLRQG